MGVYHELADVPDRYRLTQFSDAYTDRDVFQEFLDQEVLPSINTDWARNGVRRQERRWKEFMTGRRHHALATPEDVEEYAVYLLDQNAVKTASRYWTRVESFYRWLMWHTGYPHVYSPPLMAAQDGAAAEIWRFTKDANRE